MADKNVYICSDGHRLVYNFWIPKDGKNIKGFVQILHGMAEYSDRYERFAKVMTKAGFAVFAGDHRGHGETADPEELGWFAPEDGWNRISRDAFELANFITRLYGNSNTQTVLFGHSMGSFLARTMMVQYPDFYSGVIAMGTACSKGIVGKIGKIICRNEIKKNGQKSKGYKMDKLSFGAYNKAIPNPKTSFDWLSRDEREVEKYVHDSKCGFVCTNGFFYDLLTGIEFANDPKNAALIPKDLPLLIISGDCDPVGDMGKGVEKVYRLYQNSGIADVQLKLVKGARHELLNELERKETSEYLKDWIIAHI